ncbi:MAG TPA: aminotransferase class IV [Planctomycetota bacterium]|nr:aminotransferase class IV [Planctomycetota bacterium]
MAKIYLNGEFVEPFEAVVPVTDRGVLYGDGLFETMRAYGGRAFRVRDHLERLGASARALRIPLGVPAAALEEAVTELLRLNGLTNAYVRITLTRGTHTGDLALDTGEPSTLFITARPRSSHWPVDLSRPATYRSVGASSTSSGSLMSPSW